MLIDQLKNKTIFIFSSQAWGKMLLSKHHYAITLAKRGNYVYFINPPLNNFQSVRIEKTTFHKDLSIVSVGFLGIQQFRYHNQFLFKRLNRFNLKRIKSKIKSSPDIVWNFDFNGYCDYSIFPEAVKIAHPVDFIPDALKRNLKGADVLFSVAKEIIDDVKEFGIPGHFINHGIPKEFLELPPSKQTTKSTISVGYIGNLLRIDVNHSLILSLIKSNPEVRFILMGNYRPSNIGGGDYPKGLEFVEQLQQFKNVVLTGILGKEELSQKMREIDIFLLAYDKERDFCKGTNYHKVMEYLAIGNVIVSNYVSTYDKMGLLEMIDKEDENEALISIFDEVKKNLSHYNSEAMRAKRLDFAKKNSYADQVDRIELILSEQKKN